jgi:hypothetical protein
MCPQNQVSKTEVKAEDKNQNTPLLALEKNTQWQIPAAAQ